MTKSEFDILRNNFNSQINNYNTSIDNKLDGAIASYLAGINFVQNPDNLFNMYKNSHGRSPIFYWTIPGNGVQMHQAKIDCFFDKDFASLTTSYYMTTNGKTDYDTSQPTITATTETTYGEKTYGTNYTGTSTGIGNYIKVNLQRIETSDNIDYRNIVFPVSSNDIWYVNTVPILKLETSYTTQQIANIYWYDVCYPNLAGGALQSNLLYGPKLQYYRPYFEASEASIRTFEIPYISSLAGETTYHGEGFPILRALSDDTDCKVTIKIKNNLNNNENVKCLFSEKKLVNGTSFNSSAGIQKTGEFACNSEFTIDFEGIKKDGMIWINPISGPGEYVYIDSVTVKVK